MEKMDSSLISIFHADENSPETVQSLRDISSLAGVLNDLDSQKSFSNPVEMLKFLKIIQLLHEAALGLDEPIDSVDTVYYRYRNLYRDPEPPDKPTVERVINVLVKYNWLSKQSQHLKMRDRGKRLMDALIRLTNDSLAYYMQDEIERSLFQARRDAELSEAYDDRGISGGNKIASMIRNVEDAIQMLKERELEMLADRNALPQLEIIHRLMKELETKMQERFQKFQTLEESLVFSDIMQKGTAVLAEGTNLSIGMINKFLKFTSMQKTPLSSVIQPEKVREFIIQMYNPPLESDIPNAHQLFSFMEQGQYEDEAVDGLWLPVKFAPLLSGETIAEAIDYIENYEPVVAPMDEGDEEPVYMPEMISEDEIDEVIRNSRWLLTKAMIDTEKIEEYLEIHEQAPIEQVVIEATSAEWSDAINAITAISALVGNKKITIIKPDKKFELLKYERNWEWMNRDDGSNIIRTRKRTGSRSDLTEEPRI